MTNKFFFNADELYRFRTANHLSQEGLAKLLGITKIAVNRIEAHISDPSCETLANILFLYSVDGMVEFDRVFTHLPFDSSSNLDLERFFLPALGNRRPT